MLVCFSRRSLSETIFPSFSRALVTCQHSLSSSDSIKNVELSESELFLTQLKYPDDSVSITPYFLNRVISSCAKSASIFLGEQAHSTIIKLGFDSNVFIGTALVDLYSKCERIFSATQQFDEMPERNVVTWNSLISGYSHAQLSIQAFNLFVDMLKLGFTPTPFTISSVLASCAQLEAVELGIQVHGLSVKYGFSCNVVVGTALVDMYSKCSNSDDSRKCFDAIPEKNVISWTTMVSGYAHNGKSVEAMILVGEMRRLGVRLNKITYNILLSSFSSLKDLINGKQVHCLVIREGFDSDNYIVVTLLTMYSECGRLDDFCKISWTVSTSDQISWNSVIAGYSHLGYGQEALDCFRRMRQAGITIDFYTLTNVLKAIGLLSALKEGNQIHALVLKTGYTSNLYVQNGLVSMYARCAEVDDSKQVFSSIIEPDLVSWNSLLSGCAQHGHGEEAVELFEKMRSIRIKPDHSTYLSVLTACSHVGLLDRGLHFFSLMRDESKELPRVEHYACVVDLLGRAGHLNQAESFINSMPLKPGPSVFKALLSACRVHGNVDIATRSAKRLLELCPDDPATYVLLSSIFAEGGYWDDAAGMRKLMSERGVRKKPGYSWIDSNKNSPISMEMR
ncbi:Pentatricopeptide repeat-containing protein [Thalictrum thalictroides]|uniref:Pentatricopeptide repeat-containing protein n=1 Tax=Thalictrum thalictroides TaxID=46969 RepID=A0A7J6UUI6_THATH|nr:Pentatricopeptide repeat-containing protein [Thalictrum thalictroides]